MLLKPTSAFWFRVKLNKHKYFPEQDIIRVSIEEAVKIVVDSLNDKLRKEEERVADARNYIFESMEK